MSPPPSAAARGPVPIDRGDFVDSDHEGDIEDEAEDSLQYLIGYYHPTYIGQILNQRYQVVHKLGQGGFSTVWLAQDNETGKAVALKILCSSGKAANEYETHMDIKKKVRDCSRLVLALDGFMLKRIHDNVELRYPVLVLPLRGPSLMALRGTKRPLSHRISAAKNLLRAVLSIHNVGLVHRGKFVSLLTIRYLTQLINFVSRHYTSECCLWP